MKKAAFAWWLACLAIFTITITACGGGASHPAKPQVTNHPALAAGFQSSSCGSGLNHSLGECLPKPPRSRTLELPTPSGTIRCVDLSNNDPVFGIGAWRIIKAHGFQCGIFKVNESTGFVDSTAAQMAHDAKAAGLFVGGYDFLHVCGPDPGDEARVFVANLRADGLTGQDTLPGIDDSEFGAGSVDNVPCNAASWIGSWVATEQSLTSRDPMTYTGDWWWGPHVGCWFPRGSAAWISGFTGSINSVPRLCGHPGIDLWQYTDAGWNGVSSSDASVWADSTDQFAQLVNAGPTQAQFASWRRARDSSLRGYRGQHCSQPVLTREACRTLASRVNYFQVLVDQQGQGPRCFGARRQVQASICQIVRPAVAAWSRASASSYRWHNVTVARYFDARIRYTLVHSRL